LYNSITVFISISDKAPMECLHNDSCSNKASFDGISK